MKRRLALDGLDEHFVAEAWDADEYRRLVPIPAADANKYSRGYLAVLAGSSAYPGAAVLAAGGALRSGVGYTRLFVPADIALPLQMKLPMAPVSACPSRDGTLSEDACTLLLEGRTPSAFVFGPGVTVTAGTRALGDALLRDVASPCVVDADGLNALSTSEPMRASCAHRLSVTVLTPHVGEMRRLLSACRLATSDAALERDDERVRLSCTLSETLSAVVVLKGPRTVVASGERAVICEIGTPVLATAGTGDVLAGMVGAFLAQGLPAMQAAALGVYLHACAGRAAAAHNGPVSVVATDVVASLPEAVCSLLDPAERPSGRWA